MATVTEQAESRWRINGWKIAFFVTLIAFEFTREWAVLALAEEPKFVGIATVFGSSGYVSAQGRWRSIDEGVLAPKDRISPNLTRIDCWQDRGECTEATVEAMPDG